MFLQFPRVTLGLEIRTCFSKSQSHPHVPGHESVKRSHCHIANNGALHCSIPNTFKPDLVTLSSCTGFNSSLTCQQLSQRVHSVFAKLMGVQMRTAQVLSPVRPSKGDIWGIRSSAPINKTKRMPSFLAAIYRNEAMPVWKFVTLKVSNFLAVSYISQPRSTPTPLDIYRR